MILSFKNKTTAALFSGLVVKGLPPSIAQRAFDKLRLLDGAVSLEDLRIPPSNRWENYPAIAKANGVSESTTNGVFVFALWRVKRMMLK